jgi:hypothetical protein
MTSQTEPLGDRRWPYAYLDRYVYDLDGALYVSGAVALTPDQARELADALLVAADDFDGR